MWPGSCQRLRDPASEAVRLGTFAGTDPALLARAQHGLTVAPARRSADCKAFWLRDTAGTVPAENHGSRQLPPGVLGPPGPRRRIPTGPVRTGAGERCGQGPHGRGGRTAGPAARSRLVPRLEPAAWRLRVTPSQRARDGTVTEHGPGSRERESFRECSTSHNSRSFLQKQSSDQTALNSRAAISRTPAHRTHREEKAGSRILTRTGGRETAHASLMGSAAGCSPRRTPGTDTRRNLPP